MNKFIKILLILLFVTTPFVAFAKKGANIYVFAREVPAKSVYGEFGNTVKLSDFEGKFVVAVFWSRYCIPCIKELPSLAEFAQKTKNDGIKVLMISPKKEWFAGFDEQKAFLKRYGAEKLDVFVDDKNNLASALGIFSSPVTVLVNTKGEEIGRIRGKIEWDNEEVIEYFYNLKAQN